MIYKYQKRAQDPLRLLFIRHGERVPVGDRNAPLTNDGLQRASDLRAFLMDRDIDVDTYLMSSHLHARQTVWMLANDRTGAVGITVDALTPKAAESKFNIQNIVKTAESNGEPFQVGRTIALVGHENRLSQLITLMTKQRIRPLDCLDVVCVEAKDVNEIFLGQAVIKWRYPVKAYQEAELRTKVNTKMTVATFLAGFTFVALLELLINVTMPTAQQLTLSNAQPLMTVLGNALPLIATLCLTAALGLFIAAVYIYDSLSMPEGFWGISRGLRSDRLPATVKRHKDIQGLIYGYMINTWTYVFTWGVILATIGFIVILVGQLGPFALIHMGILALIGALWMQVRPKLGVD